MNLREPTKKAQWIVEYNTLVKKQKLLEKEVNGKLFGNKKNALPPHIAPLLAYQNELDKIRVAEEKSIFEQLKKIKVNISRMHQPPKDISQYQQMLENLLNFIEKEIVSYKSVLRERREKISVEEMAMEREYNLLEKRIQSIEEELAKIEENSSPPPSLPSSHPTKKVKTKVNEATPPEVVALQTFLQETGVNGGWSEKDHQQFLHIRNQCKGNLRMLVERCVYEIPEKDYGMVEDHEEWFNKFTIFLQAQKAAIQRWKEHKEAAKANELLLQEEKHAREEAKARKEEMDMRKREKEERQLRIMEWKEEQKRKEEEEHIRKLEEEERRTAEEKEREMRRRAAVKEKLKEFMAQKEDEDKQRYEEATQKQFTPAHKVTTKDLEKYQERDRIKVIEKQQKAMKDDLQKADKEARLEKLRKQVQVSVPRDPSRLTKPTAAFEVRVHEVEQKPLYPNMDFNGPFATRRAIPAWRQGI